MFKHTKIRVFAFSSRLINEYFFGFWKTDVWTFLWTISKFKFPNKFDPKSTYLIIFREPDGIFLANRLRQSFIWQLSASSVHVHHLHLPCPSLNLFLHNPCDGSVLLQASRTILDWHTYTLCRSCTYRWAILDYTRQESRRVRRRLSLLSWYFEYRFTLPLRHGTPSLRYAVPLIEFDSAKAVHISTDWTHLARSSARQFSWRMECNEDRSATCRLWWKRRLGQSTKPHWFVQALRQSDRRVKTVNEKDTKVGFKGQSPCHIDSVHPLHLAILLRRRDLSHPAEWSRVIFTHWRSTPHAVSN